MSSDNQLATPSKTALSVWSLETTQAKIQALIPSSLSWDRFKRLTTSLIQRNPKIADCEPVSLMSCLSDCAVIGVYPDPVTGKAYVIPRFNKKKQVLEATLLVGYRGLRDIALRSPDILDLWTGVVRKGDTFKMVRAPKQDLQHEPLVEENGEVLGCYSIASLRNGGISYEWMPVNDLNKIRDAAVSGMEEWKKEQSPWTLHEQEMNRKTVLRRHFKSLPLRAEDQEAAAKEFDVDLDDDAVKEVPATADETKARPKPPKRSDKGVAAVVENAPPTLAPTPPEPSKAIEAEVVPFESAKEEPKPAEKPADPVIEPRKSLAKDEVGTFKVSVARAITTPKGSMVADVTGEFEGVFFHKGAATDARWKAGELLTVTVKGVLDANNKIGNLVVDIVSPEMPKPQTPDQF